MRLIKNAYSEIDYGLTERQTFRPSSVERLSLWLLRAMLALSAALCALLVFWLWFDNIYGPSTCADIGGLLLLMTTVLLGGWAWKVW